METYEEVKAFLAECGIDEEIHPGQELDLAGFPYWRVTNWEEFCNAVKNCSVPTLGSILFKSSGEVIADVYDNFIHSNKDYRWHDGDGEVIRGEKPFVMRREKDEN